MSDKSHTIVSPTGQVLVTIHPDGTLVFADGYVPDEAAVAFWEAIARQKVENEAKAILDEHLEALILKLGEQDLRYEECQRKALSEGATPHDSYQAERARGQLEMYVHQLIELARGMVLRDRANQNGDKNLN